MWVKMSSTVVPLHVKPKTIHRTYKQHKIEIKFDPAHNRFTYSFVHPQALAFTGTGKTIEAAEKLAKQHIDKLLSKEQQHHG